MLLNEKTTDQPLPNLGLKLHFAAVDLAPNEQLETGLGVIDRDRTILRMDKLYRDDEILGAIENLGFTSTIVLIDMPKSLSIPGKWRQEALKMHALETQAMHTSSINRYEQRGIRLYQKLVDRGALVFLYFNYWTRLNYDMLLPFRSRSPQGCRALQTAIEYRLDIANLPTNLSPSSVLEAVVGAYASWSIWAGQPGVDYELYKDAEQHRIVIPRGRPHVGVVKERRVRRYRNKFQLLHENFSPKIGMGPPPQIDGRPSRMGSRQRPSQKPGQRPSQKPSQSD